jgi:ABC-type Fe3+-hydroxamate transport system substrate-binding protein
MVRERLAAGESLYALDGRLLAELRPDLVVTQDLCSVCSIDLEAVRGAAAAMDPPPRILALNPTTVEGVLDDHLRLGEAAGLVRESELAVLRLRERLYRASDYVNPYDDGPSVAFLDWTDPLYAAGHWTAQMVERAGARHPLNPTRPVEGSGAAAGPIGVTMRVAGASRRISPEELIESGPEGVIIAPCGVGLEGAVAHAGALSEAPWWGELPAVKRGRVAVVDGNAMFNRPGPRLVDAQEWLTGWVNGREELTPQGFPVR